MAAMVAAGEGGPMPGRATKFAVVRLYVPVAFRVGREPPRARSRLPPAASAWPYACSSVGACFSAVVSASASVRFFVGGGGAASAANIAPAREKAASGDNVIGTSLGHAFAA